ncbi:class I SAM-dependent methyltransferase [Ulvibacterium sp.]|uniref:class I SAM-dependent methyltransferase n=1 Tax=Ulvibacterium sp. TaxID=2665914 RepID=UPI003BA8463A
MEVKYDTIGQDYDRTRKADGYLVERLHYHLNPDSNGRYLDIGCGTGNYTDTLQKKGLRFIGIDPSETMLEKARYRNQQISWRIGTVENTGLERDSIDGITASLTLHHWPDLKKGFSELFRVLREAGRIVIFTSTPEQMKGYWLNRYFPKMMSDSIAQMPSYVEVEKAMIGAGFEMHKTEKYFIRPDLRDKFLYCGKQNPEIYFDNTVRHGISSFSSLANRAEVEKGLIDLRKDLDTGEHKQIRESYENDLGDYLYIIGKKPASIKK